MSDFWNQSSILGKSQ